MGKKDFDGSATGAGDDTFPNGEVEVDGWDDAGGVTVNVRPKTDVGVGAKADLGAVPNTELRAPNVAPPKGLGWVTRLLNADCTGGGAAGAAEVDGTGSEDASATTGARVGDMVFGCTPFNGGVGTSGVTARTGLDVPSMIS